MDTHPHIAHKINYSTRRIAALRAVMLTAPAATHQSYWSPGAADLLLRMSGEGAQPAPPDGAEPYMERLSRTLARLALSAAPPAHPAPH